MTGARACQDVEISTYPTEICSGNPMTEGKCLIDVTNIIKLNTFNQEACICTVKNGAKIRKYQLIREGLHLECENETTMFTRNTLQKVADSKRCSLKGSFIGNKCEQYNRASLNPELGIGNRYQGITRCVESCGGLGCGCGLPSSGCLFYRIFHVDFDGEVYEGFRLMANQPELKYIAKTITSRFRAQGKEKSRNCVSLIGTQECC
ncbi:hypothetical protein TELCIR_20623 [Teladorsagia circumcincta]|uniref:Phlebovirus glycoprotein G2 fusion domain-containing protein n=1 Tax=Teladorsagia circumcincta TaxID=45464 RepID=A0A2G9TJ11_TELCI|nr:hypothetical protein TELCIR_20623 [Teladorsagia circumcincta]